MILGFDMKFRVHRYTNMSILRLREEYKRAETLKHLRNFQLPILRIFKKVKQPTYLTGSFKRGVEITADQHCGGKFVQSIFSRIG